MAGLEHDERSGPPPQALQVREETRVLVAARDTPMRAGILQALAEAGLCVVAEGDVDALRQPPHVCVLDLRRFDEGVGQIDGIAVRLLPCTSVVVISHSPNADELFRALEAGASGYLPSGIRAEALVRAVRGVARGELAVPRTLMRKVVEALCAPTQGQRLELLLRKRGIELTRRECHVLDLLSNGLSTADIAQRLSITPTTVRRHVYGLKRKLGVADREAAVNLLDEVLSDERSM